MYRPTINSASYYRRVDAANGQRLANEMQLEMRGIKPFTKEQLTIKQSNKDLGILDLKGTQAHWYSDVSSIEIGCATMSLGSSILLFYAIHNGDRAFEITRFEITIGLLWYLIPQQDQRSSIIVEHQPNKVSVKFMSIFNNSKGPRIIIGRNGGFQYMGNPLEFGDCMMWIFNTISKRSYTPQFLRVIKGCKVMTEAEYPAGVSRSTFS
jgi:hypothetical protein